MSRTRIIYGMAWSHLSGVLKLETPLWWIKIKKIKKCAAVEDVRRGSDLSVSRAQAPAPEQDTASGAEAGTRDHAPLVHQLGRNTHTANISTPHTHHIATTWNFTFRRCLDLHWHKNKVTLDVILPALRVFSSGSRQEVWTDISDIQNVKFQTVT